MRCDSSAGRRGIAWEVGLAVPLCAAAFAAVAAALSSAASLQGLAPTTYALFKDLFAKNQFLQAFVASSILGALSYAVVLSGRTTISWLRGRTFCSITISNRDESFSKVIDFIGKQGIVSSGCLVASTHQKKKTWKDWRTEFMMGVRSAPKMDYAPANNNDLHVINYAGSRILMHRSKGETVVAGWERKPVQMETLSLSSWGSKVEPLKQLIDDALKASFEEQQEELNVFVMNDMFGASWEKALSKKPRAIDSVILDEDLAEGLLADARGFLSSAEWYQDVGIPYRRGYLLYGPPGCGKTSFCQALAGALKLDVCMLTLTNKNLDDNGLAESLRDAPSNAIVLLEDVDAVFKDRTLQSEGGRGAGVTFSGLLNALDGVASQEGRLFFMTTNHIERLDPALIRPGRCDIKVEVRRASRTQARKLYARFFGGSPEADAAAFADALPEYELSMAALQGYLLSHKDDPKGALAHVQRLLRSTKPLNVDRMTVFDHLRRVGLEGWAGLLEYHGYSHRADLRGLSVDTVKGWSGALRLDARACIRMGLLLSEDAKLMEDYQLIDLSTAKELFLAVFDRSHDRSGEAKAEKEADAAAPALARQNSEGLKREAVDAAEREPSALLADQFCAALQREGKPAASIFQVRRHLRLYAHSAAEAVATVGALIEPSPECGVDSLRLDELSAYEWLRRVGLEKHAAKLEELGYSTARSLYSLPETFLKECGVQDRAELKRLTALLNADAAMPRALLGFTSPDVARLRAAFIEAFPDPHGEAERHVDGFAAALSDRAGHGLVSLWQLEAYLAGCKGKSAEAAAGAARAELVEHTRPAAAPPPPPAEPAAWVYGWLKDKGLEGWAGALTEACFVEKADLQLEPRLRVEDLVALGVNKAADARKLFNLIKKL